MAHDMREGSKEFFFFGKNITGERDFFFTPEKHNFSSIIFHCCASQRVWERRERMRNCVHDKDKALFAYIYFFRCSLFISVYTIFRLAIGITTQEKKRTQEQHSSNKKKNERHKLKLMKHKQQFSCGKISLFPS